MANIRILKIDEEKSNSSTPNPYYVLILSGKPDQEWKSNFERLASTKRQQLMNVKINPTPGNELTLNTPNAITLEQMLETVQQLIAQANSKDDEFRSKIREANKKLEAPDSKP